MQPEAKRSQRSCHEESCIRMDLRKDDFATEQKQVTVIMAYRLLIECAFVCIDGIDNGINQFDTDKPPRYANDTHLSA
ncbi:unnamed protein product [Sphagnum troendelagicum]|uniref:Uncharacterized protein n=1 Tax=Sphagnum jensenii TaxID=128206 RepID=A0ABP0VNT8_9BRYO